MQTLRVYFNLHKKCLSVQAKVNGSWKVIEHAKEINLTDVTFKVSEAGRQRVIKNSRKNVHAFIYGKRIDYCPNNQWRLVSYNPYTREKFWNGFGYVDKADYVAVNGRQIKAYNAN